MKIYFSRRIVMYVLLQRKVLAAISCHPSCPCHSHSMLPLWIKHDTWVKRLTPREQLWKDIQACHPLTGMTDDPSYAGVQVSNQHAPGLYFCRVKTYRANVAFAIIQSLGTGKQRRRFKPNCCPVFRLPENLRIDYYLWKLVWCLRQERTRKIPRG